MNTTSAAAPRMRVASSDGGLTAALFISAALWPYMAMMVWWRFAAYGDLRVTQMFAGIPLVCLLGPALMLARAHCPLHALALLAALPFAILLNVLIVLLATESLLEISGLRYKLGEFSMAAEMLPSALLGGAWSVRYCRRLATKLREHDLEDIRPRRALGLLTMFATVCAASLGWMHLTSEEDRRLQVRIRVSELVLVTSSVKTALSEGMQTYGSWSPAWMSAITISATGMVASASISPLGVITVTGTAPTSNAVVTMAPTVTTDNKLVWTCTGTPEKYMPASCRK